MKRHEKLSREQIALITAQFDAEFYARFVALRAWYEQLFVIATTPIKFPAPARRRRTDRVLPKAA